MLIEGVKGCGGEVGVRPGKEMGEGECDATVYMSPKGGRGRAFVIRHRESIGLTHPAPPVKQLTDLLTQVKDEQSYIVIRERTHRNTAESTNGRVKWWSIFQLGVLIGEGIFQVWWLKKFFEVCVSLSAWVWLVSRRKEGEDGIGLMWNIGQACCVEC